jgi:hypothetical protein
MKKPLFYALLSSSFLACYAAGVFSPWAAHVASPGAEPRQRSTFPVRSLPRSDPTPLAGGENLPHALAEARGPALESVLRGGRSFGPFPAVEGALRDRFSSAYPGAEPERTLEVVARAAILEATEGAYQSPGAKADPALLGFYATVAQNDDEDPAVRRRAVRNLAAWAGKLDEDERLELFARAPARALATAGKSDAELLEEIFRGP